MKRIFAIVLAFFSCFVLVFSSGCKVKDEVIIAAPDGAPVLALYSLMDKGNAVGGKTVGYKVYNGAANIGTAIASGDADIAVMPVNVAAKLYNAGQDIKLLSVNVFGILYMVGKTEFAAMSELKGKVIVTIGKGGTPDLSLKYVLKANGIEYADSETAVEGKVAINYVNAPTEANQLVKSGKADYAILGEPVATTACKKLGFKIVMDIQKEWNAVVGENAFTQAGIVVGKNVYSDEKFCSDLVAKLQNNAEYTKVHAAKVKEVIASKGSALTVDFTADIIERCNLGCKRASENKETIENYFKAILDSQPAFIGGKLPDEGFYL